MKKITVLLYAMGTLLGGISCNSLDVPPINIIQDQDIFVSESGITAYMASLYNDLPIYDHASTINGFNNLWNSWPQAGHMSGELLNNMLFFVYDSPNGDMFQFWSYDRVRKINYFLENMPLYKDNFSESLVNT